MKLLSIFKPMAIVKMRRSSLHNFIIEENEEARKVPSHTFEDLRHLNERGSFSIDREEDREQVSRQLLNGGEHFDDHDRPRQPRDESLPRERLLRLIERGDFRRPIPN